MHKKLSRIKLLPTDTSNITFEFAYTRFILRCKAMNASPSTIEYYNQNWMQFYNFCNIYEIKQLSHIDGNIIDSYKIYNSRD